VREQGSREVRKHEALVRRSTAEAGSLSWCSH
jgi:hypothetical protein